MRRFATVLLVVSLFPPTCGMTAEPTGGADDQTRSASSDAELTFWLRNMVWHHRYAMPEICQVTGLTAGEVVKRLEASGIDESTRPRRPDDRLLVLPYPGGRHPRHGFVEGALAPQRDTKLSVFCPWDDTSYAVLDLPEAIWSNLGLTYLAHTHIDTIWTRQGKRLDRLEWMVGPEGGWVMERMLPNGILFGTEAIPRHDHVELTMWLFNGSSEPLTDLRVQNCVLLKAADGFRQAAEGDTLVKGGYAAAASTTGEHWIITAWDPVHRAWANPRCPCLHSDPKFSDCPPGETRFLRGWFSFYKGRDVAEELARIEASGWKSRPIRHRTANVTGTISDAASGEILPARLTVQKVDDQESPFFFASSVSPAGSAIAYDRQSGAGASLERHVTLSADPFQVHLPPGRYRASAMRGKEYLPASVEFTVPEGASPGDRPGVPHGRLSCPPECRVTVTLPLRRFIDMAARGWHSGDVHLHRPMAEVPTLLLAEDLNVGLPLNYWVRDSEEVPAGGGPAVLAQPVVVSDRHLIIPMNTEYEIFTVAGKRQTQGAVLVLNHRRPLHLTAPPVAALAAEARRQGALLDIDKHSWEWSLMIVPIMGVDLFELANNHHWQTAFSFPQWTLGMAPDWPEIERTPQGFTESGWTEFGMRTYYALLNCGYRLRVSAGTGSGVHPVPAGHGRVYVHTGREFSADAWFDGLNAGRSFVTTGPLLDVRFNGELPGFCWTTSRESEPVHITGSIAGLHPIKRLQIIRNGTTEDVPYAAERDPDGVWRTTVDVITDVPATGWLALRCFEDIPGGKVAFAHSNPVFLDNPRRPLRPRKHEVEYLVRRMDEELRRNDGVLSPEAYAEFRRARGIYAALLPTSVD